MQLVVAGYINVRRYQLGMLVWRALGNTVQTDLAGLLCTPDAVHDQAIGTAQALGIELALGLIRRAL